MLKKIMKGLFLSLIAISTGLLADEEGPAKKSSKQYLQGWTIGTTINTAFGRPRSFLTFGHITERGLFDVGFNYEQGHAIQDGSRYGCTEIKSKILSVLIQSGFRNRIRENVYLTYGFLGSSPIVGYAKFKCFRSFKEYESSEIDNLGWTLGVFIGLDLRLTKHFLLSTKINPYLYQERKKLTSGWIKWIDTYSSDNVVFGSGTIGLAYVF